MDDITTNPAPLQGDKAEGQQEVGNVQDLTQKKKPKMPSLKYGKDEQLDFSAAYFDPSQKGNGFETRIANIGEVAAENGVEAKLPTYDEFIDNHKDVIGEDEDGRKGHDMYNNVRRAFGLYQKGAYNSALSDAVVSDTEYGAKMLGIGMRMDKNQKKVFISNTDTYINGTPVRTSTEQEDADGLGVYKGKDGKWRERKDSNYEMLALRTDVDSNGNTRNYWQDIDGDSDISQQIRSAWGPTSVKSGNVFGSMGRGAFGQIAGKTVEGIGGFIEEVGDWIDADAQDKWSDQIGRRSANWSKYMTSMNEDEMGSAFDNWNSFMFQLGDGVAQTAQTMASAYAFGGAMSLFSKSTKIINNVAHVGSLSVSSIQKASLVRNEAKRMGMDEKMSARAYGGWFAATMIAENLGANMLTKPFGRVGAKQMTSAFGKNLDKRITGDVGKNYLKGFGKNLQKAKFRQANRQMLDFMENKMSGSLAWRLGGQFIEEWSEEGVEGILDSGTDFILNAVQLNQVENIRNKYRDVTVWDEPFRMEMGADGEKNFVEIPTYFMKVGDGDAMEMSPQQYANYKKEMAFIDRTDSKEGLFEIKPFSSFGEEGIMAGFSAALGGGASFFFQKDKSKNKDQITKIALAIVEDKKKMDTALGVIDKMYDNGDFGSKDLDFNGGVLASNDKGKSQADVNRQNVKNTLEVLVNFAEQSGFSDHKTLDAVMGNNNILSQGLDAMESVQKYTETLNQMEQEGFELKPDGVFIEEKDTKETLQVKLQVAKNRYDHFMTPKEGGKTSEAFSEYSRFYGAIEYNIEQEALKRASESGPLETKIKEYKKNYPDGNPMDSPLIAEEVKKQAEKLTPELINDPSLFVRAYGINRLDTKSLNQIFASLNPDIKQHIKSILAMNAEERQTYNEVSDEDLNSVSEKIFEAYNTLDKNFNEDVKGSTVKDEAGHSRIESIQNDVKNALDELDLNLEGVTKTASVKNPEMAKQLKARHNKTFGTHSAFRDLGKRDDTGSLDAENDADLLDGDFMDSGFAEMQKSLSALNEKISAITLPGGVADYGNTESDASKIEDKDLKTLAAEGKITDDIKWQAIDRAINEATLPNNQGSVEDFIETYTRAIANKTPIDNPKSVALMLGLVENHIQGVKAYIESNMDLHTDFMMNGKSDEHSFHFNQKETQLHGKQERLSAKKNISDLSKKIAKIAEEVGKQELDRGISHLKTRVAMSTGNISILRLLDDQFSKDVDVTKSLEAIDKLLKAASLESDDWNIEGIIPKATEIYKTTSEQDKAAEGTEQLMLDIEKIISDQFDALGSKLDKVIEEFIKKPSVGYYGHMDNLNGSLPFSFDGNNVKGYMSHAEMSKGIKNVSVKDQGVFVKWFFLESVQRINALGGENPTRKQVLAAYRDVQSQRNEDKADNKISTVEQENMIINLMSFLVNPSTDFIKSTTSDKSQLAKVAKTFIENSIYLRGYAGAGKSTVLITDAIETYSQLTGNKIKVLAIAPNSKVSQIHKEDLGNSKSLDGNLTTLDFNDVINGNIDMSNYDVVIVDEASLLKSEKKAAKEDYLQRFHDTLKKSGNPTTIFLGDDNQTSDINANSTTLPVSYRSSRTLPVTEVWRSGITVFHDIQNYYRQYAKKQGALKPKVQYEYIDGEIIGAHYQDSDKITQSFIDAVTAHEAKTGKKASDKEFALIVYSTEEYEHVLPLLEAKGLKDNLFTIEYDVNNKEHCVSGLSSQNVYVAIDFSDKKYFASGVTGKDMVSRAGLTAASRAKRFLMLPGNTSDNVEAHVVGSETLNTPSAVDIQKEILEPRSKKIERLDLLADGIEIVDVVPPTPKTGTLDRNLIGMNKNPEDVVEKTKAKRKSAKQKVSDKIPHATSTITTTQKKSSEESRLRSRALREGLLSILDKGKSKEHLSAYDVNIKEYVELNGKIAYEEGFINALRNSVFASQELEDLARSETSIINPSFKFKMNGKEYQSNPLALDVIGYKNVDGKIVPIVNLHEMKISHQENVELSDADKEKLTQMVDALYQNGYLVNEVKVHRVIDNPNIKGQGSFGFGKIEVLTDEAKADVLPKGKEFANDTDITLQDKVYNHESITHGQSYVLNGSEVIVTGVIASEGNVYVQLADSRKVLEKDFNEEAEYISATETQTLFRESSENFAKGKVYSTTAVMVGNGALELSGKKSEVIFSKSNPLVQIRQEISKGFNKDTRLEKVYYQELPGVEIKNGRAVKATHRNVIANVISGKAIDDILANPSSEMKATLKAAGVTNRESFIDKGLHIMSLDARPDLKFKKAKVSGELESQPVPHSKIDTFMNMSESELETAMDNLFDKSFIHKDVTDAERTALLNLNKYRIRVMHQGFKGNPSEYGDGKSLGQVSVMATELGRRVNGKGMSMNKLADRGTENGFVFQDVYMEKGDKTKFVAVIQRDGSYAPVRLKFDTRRLDIAEDGSKLNKTEILKELSELYEDFEKTTSPLTNLKDLSTERIKEIWQDIIQHPLYQLIQSNKHLGLMPTEKGRTFYQRSQAVMEAKEKLASVIKETRDGANMNIYRNPFGKKDEFGENTLDKKQLFSHADDVSQPIVFTMPVQFVSPTSNDSDTKGNSSIDGDLTIEEITDVDLGNEFDSSNIEVSSYETESQAYDQIMQLLGDSIDLQKIHMVEGMFSNSKGNKVAANLSAKGEMSFSKFYGRGIAQGAARHESMHFIVEYLLTPEARVKLMASAKRQMHKEGHTNDDYVSIHEYLATKFEDQSNIGKKSLLGRFLMFWKAFLNRVGLYNLNMKDFMYMADKGFYAGTENREKESQSFDKFANNYNNEESAKRLLDVFGTDRQAKVIADKVVWPQLYQLSPYGPALSFIPTSVGETFDKTKRRFSGSMVDKLGNRKFLGDLEVEVPMEQGNSIIKKISELTGEDYIRLRTNVSVENNKNALLYVNFQLSKQEILFPLIQKLYPSIDVESVDSAYRLGSVQAGQAGNQRYLDNSEMNPVESMSIMLKKQMESIPLWTYKKTRVGNNMVKVKVHKQFVNPALMESVISKSIFDFRASLRGEEFNKENLFKYLERKIDPKDSEFILNGPKLNALFSFLMEVGNISEPEFSLSNGKTVVRQSAVDKNGIKNASGMMYVLNNQEHISNTTGIDPLLIEKKAQAYEDFLSSFFVYYGSLHNRKYGVTIQTGTAKFGELTVETKSNREDTVKKSAVKENMDRIVFTDNGLISDQTESDIIKGSKVKVSLNTASIKKGDTFENLYETNENGDISISSINAKYVLEMLGVPDISLDALDSMDGEYLAKNIQMSLLLLQTRNDQNINLHKLLATGENFEAADVNDYPEGSIQNSRLEILRNFEELNSKLNIKGLHLQGVFNKSNVEEYLKLVSPTDNWLFVERLSNGILADADNSIKKMEFILGNTYYTTPLSNHLMDAFNEGSFLKPATSRFARDLKARLARLEKEGKKINTPILSADGNTFFNPIINGNIGFDQLYVMAGMETDTNMNTNDALPKEDFMRMYIDGLVLNSLKSPDSQNSISTMLDMQVDRKSLPFAKVRFMLNGKPSTIATVEKEGSTITKVKPNTKMVENLGRQMAQYYSRLRKVSLSAWNTAYDTSFGSHAELMKDLEANPSKYSVAQAKYYLEENKDYKIKYVNDVETLVPGNALSQENTPYSKLNKNSTYAQIKKAFQGEYDQLAYVFKNSQYKFPTSVSNTLGDDANTEGWHPLLEAAMWSHHFLNESVNALVRGSAITYKNTTDYVKRAGSTAPGTILDCTNPRGVGKSARVVVMQDDDVMKGVTTNKRFTPTDGGSFMNPIYQARLKASLGGISSILQDGSVKPVNFGYDALTDQKYYLKMSQLPITSEMFFNNTYYQNAMEMMLGNGLYEKHLAPLLEEEYSDNGQRLAAYKEVIENLAFGKNKDGDYLYNEHKDDIVDYIVFSSSYKTGLRGVQLFEDGSFPTDANQRAIDIPNDTYRLQQVVNNSTEAVSKSIPTQILSVISGLEHNSDLSNDINMSLMDSTNKIVGQMEGLSTKEEQIKYLNDLAKAGLINSADNDKFSRLVMKGVAHPDVNRNKFITSLISTINKSLKPKMTGSSYVQQPHMGEVYTDEQGRAYMATDLGHHGDNEEIEGYTKRQLEILHYKIDGVAIRDLDNPAQIEKLVAAGKDVELQPMEVIMPFPHRKKFGMNNDSSLRAFMNFASMDMNDPTMKMVKVGKRTSLQHRSFDETLDAMTKYIADNDIEEDELIDSLPQALQDRYFEDQKSTFKGNLRKLAQYYTDLNNALDVFSVRIPTTNASLGSVGRIVGFANESENTIFTSAEKSIFDGSDYDIDQLHVFSRALSSDGSINTDASNMIFDAIINYYGDGRNAKMIYKAITTESLEKRAASIPTPDFHGSSIATHIQMAMTNYAGKNMVGFYANFENFIFKAMAIPMKKRKKMFPGLSLLTSDKYVDQAVDFISKLVNAATDNSKLGGILGKLNVNQATTPLVYGAILSGMNDAKIKSMIDKARDLYTVNGEFELGSEEIYDKAIARIMDNPIEEYVMQMLNDEEIVEAAQKVMFSKSTLSTGGQTQIWNTLSSIKFHKLSSEESELIRHGKSSKKFALENAEKIATAQEHKDAINDRKEFIDNAIKYSLIGEQMRRFGSVVRIQQGLPTNTHELMQFRNQIEFALGSTVKEFNDKIEVGKQISNAEATGHKTEGSYEAKIRSSFNIREAVQELDNLAAYLTVMDQSIELINNTITSTQFNDLEGVVSKNLGKPRFQNADQYKAYYNGVQSYIESEFISDQFKDLRIDIKTGDTYSKEKYDLSRMSQRVKFSNEFPDMVRQWKKEYENDFMGRLEIRTAKNTKYQVVEFANSTNLTESDVLSYHYGFKKLSPSIKRAFRAYQMIHYGFQFKNGSFIDVLDDVNEEEYKAWIGKKNIESMNEEMDIERTSREIAVTEKELTKNFYSSLKDESQLKEKFSNIGKRRGKKVLVERKGEKIVPVDQVYPTVINTYTNNETSPELSGVINLRVLRGLKASDLDKAARGETVEYKGLYWNGIMKNSNLKVALAYLQDGNTAILENGQEVIVESGIEKDGKIQNAYSSMTITPTGKKKSFDSRVEIQGSYAGMGVLNVISDKIQQSFPNIKIEHINDKNKPLGQFVDGVLVFNAAKMQFDTPIHEVSHIFMELIENTSPELFQEFVVQAASLIENQDALVAVIQEEYSDLSHKDLVKEVIANILGWNSVEDIKGFLGSKPIENVNVKSNGLWNQFKSMIKNFWSKAKAYTMRLFKGSDIVHEGLKNFSFANGNLNEFSKLLTSAVMNGETISFASTKDLHKLMSNAAYDSRISNLKATNAATLSNMLTNQYNTKTVAGMNTREKIDWMKALSDKYGGVLPNYLLGRQVPKSHIDETLVKEYEDKKAAMNKGIVTWLNEGKGNVETSIKYFNTEITENNQVIGHIVNMDALTQLRRTIKHSVDNKGESIVEYALLHDSSHIEELKSLDLSAFEGYNPIVAIETDVNGKRNISIYNMTTERFNEGTQENILVKADVPDKQAASSRINLKARTADASHLNNSLLAQHIMNNTQLQVAESGVIQLSLGMNGRVDMELTDKVSVNNSIKGMSQVKEFMDQVSNPTLKALFNTKKFKRGLLDYHALLINMWKRDPGFDGSNGRYKNEIAQFQEDYLNEQTMSLKDRLNVINWRLSEINATANSEAGLMTPNEIRELVYLNAVRASLSRIEVLPETENASRDIGDISLYTKSIIDIGEESVQKVRAITFEASNRVVRKVQAFKRKMNAITQVFEDKNPGFKSKSYLSDTAGELYKDLWATKEMISEKTGRKVKANTGFIYFTTDSSKDALNYKEAAKVDKALLAEGAKIVDLITDYMLQLYTHSRQMKGNHYKWTEGKPNLFTNESREVRLAEMFEKTSYVEGMVPLMTMSASEQFRQGGADNIINSAKRKLNETTDIYNIFETSDNKKVKNDNEMFTNVADMFYHQFKAISDPVNDTVLGTKNRSADYLGIVNNGNDLMLADASKNDLMSKDLGRIMENFALTVERKKVYEDEVLPMINGIRVMLRENNNNLANVSSLQAEKYIDMFTERAIAGEFHETKQSLLGADTQKVVLGLSGVVTGATLALNYNVGIMSSAINGMKSFIEGISNSIADNGIYGVGNLIEASALFISDKSSGKITQLVQEFQLVNQSESELINHKTNVKTKRSIFDEHSLNWFNWASDYYARAVIMTAQMIKDGSYDAYSYNENEGVIAYDVKQDRRFYNIDGSQSEEQKAFEKFIRERLVEQEIMNDVSDVMPRGYTHEEAQQFKYLSDKYIIGAYDTMTKNNVSNYFLGRIFSTFHTYMTTMWYNATAKGEWQSIGGKYQMIKNDQGHFVPKWERHFTEGYFETLRRMAKVLASGGSKEDLWGESKATSKYNLGKFATQIGMFMLMYMLYNGLVDDDGEDSWMERMGIKSKNIVKDYRVIRNMKYSYESLFTVVQAAEIMNNPLIAWDIFSRVWNGRYKPSQVTAITEFLTDED